MGSLIPLDFGSTKLLGAFLIIAWVDFLPERSWLRASKLEGRLSQQGSVVGNVSWGWFVLIEKGHQCWLRQSHGQVLFPGATLAASLCVITAFP